MEKSANYNFNLPNSANDEIADINDISDNFRIIDEIMKETEQTFSDISENPQSGTAVAEALSAYVPKAVAQAVETCSPAIVTTSDTAKAFAVNDSSESVIKNLNVFCKDIQIENPNINILGKNLLPYPYRTNGQTVQGITYTVNSDGTITINGTSTALSSFLLHSNITLKAGTYVLSGCPLNSENSYFMFCIAQGIDSPYWSDYGNTLNGTVKTFETDVELQVQIRVLQGKTVNNILIKPQIEMRKIATPYEPYNIETLAIPYTFTEGDALTVGNGLVKVNISNEETDITSTEIGQSLVSLKTKYPTTSVISDIDLDITYKADTKNYIDNKIAELTALTLEG